MSGRRSSERQAEVAFEALWFFGLLAGTRFGKIRPVIDSLGGCESGGEGAVREDGDYHCVRCGGMVHGVDDSLSRTNEWVDSLCDRAPAHGRTRVTSGMLAIAEGIWGGLCVEKKREPGDDTKTLYSEHSDGEEVFARKVFVGGLPIDVSEEEISSTFSTFGPVLVDWPRRPDRNDSSSSRHMTGYVFLVFEEERSVQSLVRECHQELGRYYLFVSSPTMRNKPVQVRPWRLSDMDYMLNPSMRMDPRRTVFIGGVPRPTRANELADVLDRLYGTVCYVGIDIDPELKYPKGAARVTFASTHSFIAAIQGRFVHIPHAETKKRVGEWRGGMGGQVEIKPYVMDDQMCDECCGKNCSSRYAPYFCGDVSCLQYYCESCWDQVHYYPWSRRASHRPLVRQGDQTKMLFRPSHHPHPRRPTLTRPPF